MATPRPLARSRTGSEENDSAHWNCISEFLNIDSNSAHQVLDEMVWHEEIFFWSWDLVRWPLNAPRGCLILLGIFGERFEWISPNLTNLVQTCSKCSLKILNWRPVDLHGSWLRVQRTRKGNWFGGKNQNRKGSSFVNLQGSRYKAEIVFDKK